MRVTEILKTRVTPEIKARVGQIREAELLTEAVWLRRVVSRAIRQAASTEVPAIRDDCSGRLEPAARLTVRLPREDRLLLQERAAARGMASATYVSVLVRSHFRALTPLPRDELAGLKRAVGELGAIRRNLNQISRTASQGGRIGSLGRDEFTGILKVCEALRDHIKDLIKANAASWRHGHAEDAS